MNPGMLMAPHGNASPRVEFFRMPAAGKRDPFFNLSRAWYYKAAANGEIKVIHVRQRGALKGVTLIVYDSVCAYFRRSIAFAPSPECHDTPHDAP